MNLAVNGTQDFAYRGSVDCAYLKKEGRYKLEVWGASGGNFSVGGGYGGYARGVIQASENSSLYVVVGGVGADNASGSAGGYNGGATGQTNGGGIWYGAGAGGVTHISVQNCGELKNCESYKGTYDSSKGTYDGGKILVVAGGGGGDNDSKGDHPGSGGGISGGNGFGNTSYGGTGGNQTTGGHNTGNDGSSNSRYGSFGLGGQTLSAGGGGGWYGGGATSGGHCCGGGGSGYIGNSLLLQDKGMYQYSTGCTSSTAAATKTTCTTSTGAHVSNAANTGDGYARITYLGT